MNKVITTTLGVILATSAATAFAGKQDREYLAQCKADISAHYGEDTRIRLHSIKRGVGQSHLQLRVTPADGDNNLVVCSVARDGISSLTTRDGIALTGSAAQQTAGLAQ